MYVCLITCCYGKLCLMSCCARQQLCFLYLNISLMVVLQTLKRRNDIMVKTDSAVLFLDG